MISLKEQCVLVWRARDSQSQIKFENRKCKKSRRRALHFLSRCSLFTIQHDIPDSAAPKIHLWKHRNVPVVAVFSPIVLSVEINSKKTTKKENVFRLDYSERSPPHNDRLRWPRTNHPKWRRSWSECRHGSRFTIRTAARVTDWKETTNLNYQKIEIFVISSLIFELKGLSGRNKNFDWICSHDSM